VGARRAGGWAKGGGIEIKIMKIFSKLLAGYPGSLLIWLLKKGV
jgi:hypothetical protein